MLNRIDPGRRNHPSVPAGGVPPAGQNRPSRLAETLRAEQNLQAQQRAVAANLIHRGRGESIDLRGRIENPTVQASIVSFKVDVGFVARIDAIAVWYSEPLVPMCRSVGWNLLVNGSRVPYIQNTEDTQRYDAVGDLARPIEIAPVWVQAGETVSIDVVPLYSFDCALVMIARLSGRLYRIDGPNILRED
jgi:hypothetical protein